MRAYKFNHLSDGELLTTLTSRVAQERVTTAEVVALIAEVDERKLYLPAGYPSMSAYCVQVLRFSEDAAHRRIDVARYARQFPAIFPALADGRLHLTAVLRLAPYLSPERADSLLAAAMNKSRSEIDLMLAARFPKTEVLPLVQALPSSPPAACQPALARVETLSSTSAPAAPPCPSAPAPAPPRVATPPTKTAPVAADRFLWQLTVGKSAQDKLEYARQLLSHQLPSGDMAEVLEKALDALIKRLEQRKFSATDKPRPSELLQAVGKRTIPAHVKRQVWNRDQGRCTFVGETGHQCGSRRYLEYDHVDPVARGGKATPDNIRLRCRAHNQFEAEQVLGSGFMSRVREATRPSSEAIG